MSEIDYKICILKNKDSPLSEREKEWLENLTEQKALQKSCCLLLIKTAKIPSDWISDNETSSNAPKKTSSGLQSFLETSKSVKSDDLKDAIEASMEAGKLGESNGKRSDSKRQISYLERLNKIN